MRQAVRENMDVTTVSRPTEQIGRYGDVDDTYQTHSAEMWLFDPNETHEQTDYGVRLEGTLRGLAMPSADIEVRDEVDHGGETYEVLDIEHVNSNSDKTLKVFGLDVKNN